MGNDTLNQVFEHLEGASNSLRGNNKDVAEALNRIGKAKYILRQPYAENFTKQVEQQFKNERMCINGQWWVKADHETANSSEIRDKHDPLIAAAQLSRLRMELHYPGCWDTMAYPTIWDALFEMAHCSECSTKRESVAVEALKVIAQEKQYNGFGEGRSFSYAAIVAQEALSKIEVQEGK